MMFTAIKVNNITISPKAFDDCLFALIFSSAICCQRNDIIEFAEIYHRIFFVFLRRRLRYEVIFEEQIITPLNH